MRTIEQLLEIMNPEGIRNNKWTYWPVEHIDEFRVSDGELVKDTYVCMHEVFFDKSGGFTGATAACKSTIGSDIDDLRGTLTKMLESCDKPVISFDELQLIRS